MSKMNDLIAKINELRRKEVYEMQKAGQYALAISKLKAKQLKCIEHAKKYFAERKEVALEYHRIKPQCNRLLAMAEKELGRKLSYDEVVEVEKFYAEKAAKH